LRDDDRFRVARGLVYDDLGQYDAARSDYRAVLGRNPRDAAALIGLAKILEKQGDRAQAIETLERGRDADPNSALIRLNLGIIYELAGRMYDAGGEYARATELDALNGEAWYRSGLIQMHRGETKRAIPLFEQAIAAGGLIEAPSRATLARLYRQTRLFDKAELILVLADDEQFEKVIELAGAMLLREPRQASILLVKGSAERHLGRLKAAEDSLRASAELENENPLVHYELALLLRTLGKADEAARHAELSKTLQAQEFHAGSSASYDDTRVIKAE
jgi:tetratricopeptide (TPR) repeat protein